LTAALAQTPASSSTHGLTAATTATPAAACSLATDTVSHARADFRKRSSPESAAKPYKRRRDLIE